MTHYNKFGILHPMESPSNTLSIDCILLRVYTDAGAMCCSSSSRAVFL